MLAGHFIYEKGSIVKDMSSATLPVEKEGYR